MKLSFFVALCYILCRLPNIFGQDLELESSEPIRYSFAPSWVIDNMAEIENARTGERFESPEFEIGNASWQIISFPNGNDERTAGSYMLFLALKRMPQRWKEVTVRFTVSSVETLSRFTRIATYNIPKGLGWYPESLLLEELIQKKLDKIEWIVDIYILQIISDDDQLIYQRTLNYKNTYHIKWRVGEQELDEMQHALRGKSFERPQNFATDGYKDDMFTIRVIPNGKDQYVDLYLSLYALPVNIGSIKIEYTLRCLETATSSTYTTYFSYHNSYWSWKNFVLPTDDFKNVTGGVTFVADVQILNYFDRDGIEVVTMPHILQLHERMDAVEKILIATNAKELAARRKENNILKQKIVDIQQQMDWLIAKLQLQMGFAFNLSDVTSNFMSSTIF